MKLLCFVHAKTLCMYGCMYFLAELVLVCVDVKVMNVVPSQYNVVFCIRVAWVCLVCLLQYKKEGSSAVS